MHNVKISLTKDVDINVALSQLKSLISKFQLSPNEEDMLITNATKTIKMMIESGDKLISQGCNFVANQKVKSNTCRITIHANYRVKPFSFIEKIFAIFRS